MTGKTQTLVSAGLTNKGSEDYGIIASAKPIIVSFAMCCGNTVKDKNKVFCEVCQKALFWRREPIHTAEHIMEQYITKHMKLQIYKQTTAAERARKMIEDQSIKALRLGADPIRVQRLKDCLYGVAQTA